MMVCHGVFLINCLGKGYWLWGAISLKDSEMIHSYCPLAVLFFFTTFLPLKMPESLVICQFQFLASEELSTVLRSAKKIGDGVS